MRAHTRVGDCDDDLEYGGGGAIWCLLPSINIVPIRRPIPFHSILASQSVCLLPCSSIHSVRFSFVSPKKIVVVLLSLAMDGGRTSYHQPIPENAQSKKLCVRNARHPNFHLLYHFLAIFTITHNQKKAQQQQQQPSSECALTAVLCLCFLPSRCYQPANKKGRGSPWMQREKERASKSVKQSATNNNHLPPPSHHQVKVLRAFVVPLLLLLRRHRCFRPLFYIFQRRPTPDHF